MKDVRILGVDLGKNSCSVVGLDAGGQVVLRRRMRRDGVVALAAKLPGCVVAMEACCGAHHLGRLLAARGHEVRLMSPEYVRPYVKAQKNDDLDAEAIAEAASRPTMRFVEVKSEGQSDVQALHRARERLVSERTALINHLRALLLERGIVVPQGRRKLEQEIAVFADEDAIEALSPRIRRLIEDLRSEWRTLDERIAAFDAEFVRMAREDEAVRRRDVLIAVVDGLKGFPEAITAVFPQATVQTCIVHLLRHSLDFVSWKDRKPVAAALKGIYRAIDADAGEAALTAFEQSFWGQKYPAIGQSWRRAWGEVVPFYAFPGDVRRILYTTNAIEALNAKLRRAVRARGHFPTDEAATKLLFLVLNRSEKEWIMPPREWSMAKSQFAVLFGERFTMAMA